MLEHWSVSDPILSPSFQTNISLGPILYKLLYSWQALQELSHMSLPRCSLGDDWPHLSRYATWLQQLFNDINPLCMYQARWASKQLQTRWVQLRGLNKRHRSWRQKALLGLCAKRNPFSPALACSDGHYWTWAALFCHQLCTASCLAFSFPLIHTETIHSRHCRTGNLNKLPSENTGCGVRSQGKAKAERNLTKGHLLMCTCRLVHATAHMGKTKDNLRTLALCFYYIDPKDQTQGWQQVSLFPEPSCCPASSLFLKWHLHTYVHTYVCVCVYVCVNLSLHTHILSIRPSAVNLHIFSPFTRSFCTYAYETSVTSWAVPLISGDHSVERKSHHSLHGDSTEGWMGLAAV
jgi:hypothetical protein